MTSPSVNVGSLLSAAAQRTPDALAIAAPVAFGRPGPPKYRQWSFRELDEDSNRIADGLRLQGAQPGARVVLAVRPGLDFISSFFATLKAGVTAILIDPGMGLRRAINCLAEAKPEGFFAIPPVHVLRWWFRGSFPRPQLLVTAGRRWFWGGCTLEELRASGDPHSPVADTTAQTPAAIIYTTGSTGPPKGVLYRHGNFAEQARQLQQFYGIEPGEIDLPGFPLFALFNCAMGVATVVPDMDFTRPAKIDPKKVVAAVRQFQCTQMFGSPAMLNTLGRYLEEHGVRLPSLRRVLSAGAAVPPHVLRRMKRAIHPAGQVHTPYGATESLPVASIEAGEVLGRTIAETERGQGVCVGRRFSGIQWKVIAIEDRPLARMAETRELAAGEIGELMVSGPVVTDTYATSEHANALHKVRDESGRVWHRMGDVGWLDEQDRFWFCGRKSHRVSTNQGVMFTIPCEAILNQHPRVYRSALVGVSRSEGSQPVAVVELWPEHRVRDERDAQQLMEELKTLAQNDERTKAIESILIRRDLPVDIRHNAKIFREEIATWAAGRLKLAGN